ncbi:hypothetical protein CB1_000904005 [Camelus ferus]|nr:hypothetical protein CB1_000904005 [Camelus ferus]
MKELHQLQQEDLARRRQTVARMPPQLVELPYKRSEMKEDWQRELEFAFEDMYNADRKPLPTVTDQIQDEELDLSMEQESLGETENIPVTEAKAIYSGEADIPLAVKTHQIPSKLLFKKLLNKIRSQKSLWTIQSVSEEESEMITTVSETESKAVTFESGATVSEDRTLSSEQEKVVESDTLTVDSGPLTSEDKPLSYIADSEKKQEMNETQPITAVAQSSVLLHPHEEAARIRMAARQKQVGTAPASGTVISDEDSHRQMIRNYQQQLLQQNRLHRQSVETARKRLLEYQTMLKEKYPSMSATPLVSDSVASVPPQESEQPAVISEHQDQGQRPKLSPDKHQPVQPMQISNSEQDSRVPRQKCFPQRQVETTGTLITSDVLAKQALEPQEQLKQLSQSETQQRDYTLVPKDSHTLSRALSHEKPLTLQEARERAETSRATAFPTSDSQQVSEDSGSVSCKLIEPSSFLPLVPERSFSCLPTKVESGDIQEPFSAMSKSIASVNHYVVGQMQEKFLPSSETITAQQDNLKALQEQLDLQKEVLRSRQAAQEQLLLCKQKELEGQTGLSVFLPLVPLDSFASLPFAKAESGRNQESSPTKNETAGSSGHPGVLQVPDRLLSFSQPILSQQDNFKFLQEQLSIQRDSLQARREAQEVLCVHKQGELDGRVWAQQSESPSLPSQVAQRTFTSMPSAGTQSQKIQKQYSPKSEKGLLSSQSEIPKSHDGSSSFLQQFLPLHDSLKLLQEQLTTQRDALQARYGAQAELLLRRQRNLGASKSVQMSSSFPPTVAHRSVASQASKTGPGRIQNFYFSEESVTPSSYLVMPTFQDASLRFPQCSLPQQQNLTPLQGQSHIQRVTLGAKPETQEIVHKQNELEKKTSSEQTATSLSLSQGAESERFQEFKSLKSDSPVPLSHSKIPRFQERLLGLSQHVQTLRDDLEGHQRRLDPEEEALHLNQETQGNVSSEQAGLSFIPQLGQLSLTSLPSAESLTTQEPLSVESDGGHFQIPQLQDRLLKITQLIHPQQDNLRALQEQLATQREAIIQSRQEARGESLLREQSEWKGRASPEQAGTLSFLVQHPFSPLPLRESGRIREPCSTKSDNVVSGHSEVPRSPGRLAGLPEPVSPKQDYPITFSQEHLYSQTNSLPSIENTQKEMVLPRQYKFEDKSSEHFIQPHHGDLKARQQQSDTQNEVQEELLLQRTSKPTVENNFETQKLKEWLPHLQDLAKDDQENISPADRSSWDENQLLSEDSKAKQSGKSEFYQDRDPLRVSISREQSFLGSPLDRDPRGHLHPVAQENIRDADSAEAVKVEEAVAENHAVLSHAVEKEEHPYLGPSVKPDEKRSDSSCESLHTALSPRSTASFTALRRTSLHSSLSTSLNQQPGPNVAHAAAQSFAAEDTEGSEQSFQELLPEFSSQEGSQHADLPSIFSIEARDSFQGMESQNYSEQNEESQNKQKSVHFQLSVGNLQSSVFNSSGEAHVFHQLNLQHSTPCGSASSECSIKDQLEGRKDRLGFEELSERGVDTVLQGQGFTEDDKNKTCGVVNINPQVEEIDSQLCATTVEIGTSIQTPYSLTVPNERCLENSTKAEAPRITGNLSQLAQSELFVSSGSFSLQSSIPVWETESGHGIMEEPDLTLISTSDISIAETDFANLTLGERENEAKSCFQVSEFLPLVSETENSDYPAVSEHPVEKPAVSAGSFQLKGVNKVRVSLPEDRKTAQAHMHQRAQRLYRQLAEVKQQKEEKAKQEAYAQNRARAKEFHKRTLEKLRAKNTH